MAEKETMYKPKDLIEPVPEEIAKLEEDKEAKEILELEKIGKEAEKKEKKKASLSLWIPKTKLGRLVKEGKEKNIDDILEKGKKILEPEITDYLLDLEFELILIGQAKGKFGGGKRRAWRQTQKKTQEGNIITFSSMVVVGDKNTHVGIGYGRAKETLPARGKALREAKLNIIKIARGYEDPNDKSDPHTVPFKVEGKCGSVRVTLHPAPRGTGLVIGDEAKKILRLAGIKDVYSRTKGNTRTTFNFAKACIDALIRTTKLEVK